MREAAQHVRSDFGISDEGGFDEKKCSSHWMQDLRSNFFVYPLIFENGLEKYFEI